MARPKKPIDQLHSTRREVLLTPAQDAKLRALCKKLHRDKATLLRDLAFKQMDKEYGEILTGLLAS